MTSYCDLSLPKYILSSTKSKSSTYLILNCLKYLKSEKRLSHPSETMSQTYFYQTLQITMVCRDGLFNVIPAFCTTGVPQNAEITWKRPSSGFVVYIQYKHRQPSWKYSLSEGVLYHVIVYTPLTGSNTNMNRHKIEAMQHAGRCAWLLRIWSLAYPANDLTSQEFDEKHG